MLRLVPVLAFLSMASAAAAQTPLVSQGPPAIVAHGEGIVKKAPDRAWITVATETRDPKPADARRRSAEAMTAIQDQLKRAGIPGDALRTTGYSLMPDMEYNNGRSTLKGYVVRNQIDVRVDDLDKLSDVLDVVNAPKATGLSIVGPRFDLKNQQAAETEALKLAVEAAMARAQAIAAGARRSVGAILRIEEDGVSSPGPRPMPMSRMTMESVAAQPQTPIVPGEIEIRAQVTLTVAVQ
jgi:hypothetical protein